MVKLNVTKNHWYLSESSNIIFWLAMLCSSHLPGREGNVSGRNLGSLLLCLFLSYALYFHLLCVSYVTLIRWGNMANSVMYTHWTASICVWLSGLLLPNRALVWVFLFFPIQIAVISKENLLVAPKRVRRSQLRQACRQTTQLTLIAPREPGFSRYHLGEICWALFLFAILGCLTYLLQCLWL